ncbi:MAG TPA: glycosyltransferase family 4 protein [Anaerohalosphaeraceae bacterium]|nr:glycosyltransferase family 4 protein [Anaerohalosphaeraceae bacterium]HOL31292.1 glycosyltransferase family 4 protein [Anaerohalosphaeraceae bacterium]HOM76080.1 glycosyltransferase family 4 protein [Anaerohalosphaeraceae bacterium]HPC64804.1 glycosyltransferase family 4 protein [Anaerohalosphaeraceae bacterium]HPO69655.1 glycosyltransferase family 4 protein [Anaerohalosphaeraceae bacterium]
MRIIQLTPGSGDTFYCENCLRDGLLVQTIRRAGQDIVMVPMYLPLSRDTAEAAQTAPLFFGGVNVWLQQKCPLFGKTPRWLDALFDSPLLLKGVRRLAGMTRAADLGPMTVSMLAGPEGRQAKEVQRLVDFFQQPLHKPDICIFSNLLLAGLAGPIKERLQCKLVCWLQDERGFIEALGMPWSRKVWNRISELLPLFDMFISVSRFYAQVMQECLPIPAEKMAVLPPGIDVSLYEQAAVSAQAPTIGFLGRMCWDNGLDILQEAFCRIVQSGSELSKNLRLLICGGRTSADKKYIERIEKGFENAGIRQQVQFMEDFDFQARHSFLKQLTVLCTPSRQTPGYAMNVLEAMACGVPFAAPNIGVYGEWAQMTGGGILYESNTPLELEKTLRQVLQNPDQLRRQGTNARTAVQNCFDIRKNAQVLMQRLHECRDGTKQCSN